MLFRSWYQSVTKKTASLRRKKKLFSLSLSPYSLSLLRTRLGYDRRRTQTCHCGYLSLSVSSLTCELSSRSARIRRMIWRRRAVRLHWHWQEPRLVLSIFTTYLPGFPLKAATSFHESQRTIWPDGVLYQLTIAARGLWRHHHHLASRPRRNVPFHWQSLC